MSNEHSKGKLQWKSCIQRSFKSFVKSIEMKSFRNLIEKKTRKELSKSAYGNHLMEKLQSIWMNVLYITYLRASILSFIKVFSAFSSFHFFFFVFLFQSNKRVHKHISNEPQRKNWGRCSRNTQHSRKMANDSWLQRISFVDIWGYFQKKITIR